MNPWCCQMLETSSGGMTMATIRPCLVTDSRDNLRFASWSSRPRHFADEKARSRGPDVADALVPKIIRLVQVAAGDEGNGMAAGQLEEPRTRLRLDRPIPGIALVRDVEKERAVEKPGDLPSPGIAHDALEPAGLHRFFGVAAAEEQRIEAN